MKRNAKENETKKWLWIKNFDLDIKLCRRIVLCRFDEVESNDENIWYCQIEKEYYVLVILLVIARSRVAYKCFRHFIIFIFLVFFLLSVVRELLAVRFINLVFILLRCVALLVLHSAEQQHYVH